MPQNVEGATAGVPISPNSGGVEETVQRERNPSVERKEQQAVEDERARRTEEEAAQETEKGRTVNSTI